jgi:hypothetical protein
VRRDGRSGDGSQRRGRRSAKRRSAGGGEGIWEAAVRRGERPRPPARATMRRLVPSESRRLLVKELETRGITMTGRCFPRLALPRSRSVLTLAP